ncbi:MAG: TetR/AcrR family transcriptional regulator [Pseudomonadota bacterium]
MATVTSPSRSRITAIAEKTLKRRKKEGYHHGDLRAELVAATRELVETKGPDKFSVSEACRIAGVSTAAPYRHFETKTDMLFAVAIDGMERQRIQMEETVRKHARGSAEAIAALGDLYIAFAVAEEGVFRLAFGLTRGHDQREDLPGAGERCFGVVIEEVRLYLRKPAIDREVMDRAFSLWTMVHGMSFLIIDKKLAVMELPIDTGALIRENTVRILGPRPAA